MLRIPVLGGALAVAVLAIGASAHAHVLSKDSQKELFKLRADVSKQVRKLTTCVAKATLKCEKFGVSSVGECDPLTGAVSYEPVAGDQTAKFQGALAKCDDKANFIKKGTDYTGIGCPGDCGAAAGTQPCADLPAYEALTSQRVRSQFNSLAAAMDAACASAGTPDSEARIDCVADAGKELRKYAAALYKCEHKCEVDEKGNKGGGSLTNAGACLVSSGSPEFSACETKAAEKLTTAASDALRLMVASLTDGAVNNLFNRSDPTDPDAPAGTLSPCGTCGNNTREGAEVCDGTALGTCLVCAADCTCAPPECGNNIIEGTEACDGTALGSCLVCASDCTCAPPECGNNIIEGTEECDGTALGTCDACDVDCTCAPLSVCGNNIIEGTEECDGTSPGTCDACAVDCTCTDPVCGNNVIEGTEECDGTSVGSCDGACDVDCTCAPVCGNNVIEGDEDCDGTALGTCSACAGDCSCIVDPILDGPAGTFCTTAINAGVNTYQPLCVPTAGSGHHFRMEGVYMGSANNGFVYLALGFASGLETSSTAPPTPSDGDGRFVFTAGKSISCTYSWNYFRYTGISSPNANPCLAPKIFDGYRDTGDYPGARTVCMDVTGANPPRVTFWATGANGADCKNKDTLTAVTALYSKDDWSSANIQPIANATHYAKINNITLATMTSVSVSSNTVLP